TYPPSTAEFSSIIRALNAAKPDIVYVASYPPDSAAILRAINEIGVGVNFNTWLPEPSMYFDGTKAFFETYSKRAVEAKVDPLGYYLAPYGFTMGQLIEQAVTATKSLDQKTLAKYLREHVHKTIVGPIEYAEDGEWKETATLEAQFRGVKDKNLDQFRTSGKQVILFPERLKTGDLVTP